MRKIGSFDKRGKYIKNSFFTSYYCPVHYYLCFSSGGVRNRAYKRRWFVLTEYGKCLYFPDESSTQSLGHFTVIGATITEPESISPELHLITQSRLWEFCFDSHEDLRSWSDTIKDVVRRIDALSKKTAPTPRRRVSCLAIDPQLQSAHAAGVAEIAKIANLEVSDEEDSDTFTGNEIQIPAPAQTAVAGFINRESPRLASVFRAVTVEDVSELRVICATWNMAEELPEMDNVSFFREYRHADIVCIGVQECQSVMHRNSAGQIAPVDVWQAMCLASLGPTFELLSSKVMGGIHIAVYCKIDVRYLISIVTSGFVACGIGNVMHNKGGVGISFNFKSTSLCFVVAHFQANRQRVLERNDDFWRIDTHMPAALGKLNSYPSDADGNGTKKPRPQSRMRRVSMALGIGVDVENRSRSLLCERFDHCFFMGDFNYRLEMEVSDIKRHLTFADKLADISNDSASMDSRPDDQQSVEHNSEAIDFDLAARAMRLEMAQTKTSAKFDDEQEDRASEDKEDDDDEEDDDVFADEKGASNSSGVVEEQEEKLEDFVARTGLRTRREVLDHLLTVDQLNIHRAEGKVFVGYEESAVDFKPSYKFDPFTEVYDTGKKNRGAAWCDRVLYSKKNQEKIHPIVYKCHHGVYHTDHRAVMAEFLVDNLQ